MAILESLPGVEVTVCVNKEPLPEYDPDPEEVAQTHSAKNLAKSAAIAKHQASKTVSKYIESTDGQTFTISCSVKAPYKFTEDATHLSFCTYIDGIWASTKMLSKESYLEHNRSLSLDVIGNRSGNETEQWLQSFKFAKIQMVQDATKFDAAGEDHDVGSLGTIEIRVYREKDNGQTSKPNIQQLVKGIEVQEKKLKGQAKSHGILLGDAVKVKTTRFMRTDYCDGIDWPIAIFTFNYRSRKDLQILGLIERTPEPEPTPNLTPIQSSPAPRTPGIVAPSAVPNLKIENMDRTQAAQLINQLQQYLQNQGPAQIPTPGAGTAVSSTPDRPIKRERESDANNEAPKSKRRQRGKVTVTVDLTGDDSDDAIEVE